jgi:predicted AlkP superfamily phosphohydrolase/phosphomutase
LKATREQADFGLEALRSRPAEVFFLNLLTIDRIQHFLWRHCDPDDPTYPGPNPLSNAIVRSYQLVDEIIGRYLDAVSAGDILVVLSDHGHGRRPTRMLYLDELLRRERLFNSGAGRALVQTFVLDKAKRAVLTLAYRAGLEDAAYRLARRLPGRKALKSSSYSIGKRSVARTSRAFGRNSTGGVEISDQLTPRERRAAIDHVSRVLEQLIDPMSGERVCVWVKERSDVVLGKHADRFPDLLFQLREGIGIDYGVFGPLFGPDMMHRRISGGHRDKGVFASNVTGFRPPESLYEVYDVLRALAVPSAEDVR